MITNRLLPLATLAVAALVAVGISFVAPAEIARYTRVLPPQDVLIACQPVGEGTLLADGRGELTIGGDGSRSAPFAVEGIDSLTTLRGIAPSGGVLTAAGDWAPCQRPGTRGLVSLPDAATAEIRVTNPDATDASVDLTLLGPDGEVTGLGARGITLAPGESRPVAVSVIADGADGPLGVLWQTSRGRVVVAGVTTGDETLHVAGSGGAGTRHLLPGIAAGATPTVVLVNPGTDRATASITFHSPTSTLVPEGGQDISIPPRSAVAAALGAGTAGEPGAFTVDSDLPVAVTLYSGTGERRAAAVSVEADLELAGVLPGGAKLQVTNLGESVTDARVDLSGATHDLRIEPGATATLDVGEGELMDVTVSAGQPVIGAGVVAHGIIPLSPASLAEPRPMDAELVPALR